MIKQSNEKSVIESKPFSKKLKEKVEPLLKDVQGATRAMCYLTLGILGACGGETGSGNSSSSNVSTQSSGTGVSRNTQVSEVKDLKNILDVGSIRVGGEYHVVSTDSGKNLFNIKDVDDRKKDGVIPFDFSDERLKGHSGVYIKQYKNAVNKTTGVASDIGRSIYLSLGKSGDLYDGIRKVSSEKKLITMNGATSLLASLMKEGQMSYKDAKQKASKALGVKESELTTLYSSTTSKTLIYKLDVIAKIVIQSFNMSSGLMGKIASEILYNINSDNDKIFSQNHIKNICSYYGFPEEKYRIINLVFTYLNNNKLTKTNEERIEKMLEFYNKLISEYEMHRIDNTTFEYILNEYKPERLNLKGKSVTGFFSQVIRSYYNQQKVDIEQVEKDEPEVSIQQHIDKVLEDTRIRIESEVVVPISEDFNDNNLAQDDIPIIKPIVENQIESTDISIVKNQPVIPSLSEPIQSLPVVYETEDSVDRSNSNEVVLKNANGEKKSIWVPNDQIWLKYSGISSAISEGYKYLNTEFRWVDRSAMVFDEKVRYRYQEKSTHAGGSNSARKIGIVDYRDHKFTGKQEYQTFEGEWVGFNIGTSKDSYGSAGVGKYLEGFTYFLKHLSEKQREEQLSKPDDDYQDPITYSCALEEFKKECENTLFAQSQIDNGLSVNFDTEYQNSNGVILSSEPVSMDFEFGAIEGDIINPQNSGSGLLPCDKITDELLGCEYGQNVKSRWPNGGSEDSYEFQNNPLYIFVDYGEKPGENYPAKIWIEYSKNGVFEKTEEFKVNNFDQKETIKRYLLRFIKGIQDIELGEEIPSQYEVDNLRDQLFSFDKAKSPDTDGGDFQNKDKMRKLFLEYYIKTALEWMMFNDGRLASVFSEVSTKLSLNEIDKIQQRENITLTLRQKELISEQIVNGLKDGAVDGLVAIAMQYKEVFDSFINADINQLQGYIESSWAKLGNIGLWPRNYVEWFEDMKDKAYISFNLIKDEILPSLTLYQKTYGGSFIASTLLPTLYESSLSMVNVVDKVDNYLDLLSSSFGKKFNFGVGKLEDLVRLHREKMLLKKLSVPHGFELSKQTRGNFGRIWEVVDLSHRSKLEEIRSIANKEDRWKAGEKFIGDLFNGNPRQIKKSINGKESIRNVDCFYENNGETFIGEVKTYQRNVNVNTFIREEIRKDMLLEKESGLRPVWYIIGGGEEVGAGLLKELGKNGIEYVIIKL